MMIMPNSTAHVEGVEIRRGGQRGAIRRYPFHWHMLSYSGSQTLDDATGQYLRRSSINSSMNRGIVIHGTNGVTVQDNILFDIRGHGIFFENASERRNIIDGNLVFHVRNPQPGFELKEHEQGILGSSGFWISNPDNTIINNTSADTSTFGFWLAFPEQPFGESSQVLGDDGSLMRPNRMTFGVFDNNTSHSNRNDGFHLDNPEINEAGGTFPIQYYSTVGGQIERFTISRSKTWKNMDNGFWDRAAWSDLEEFVSADNCGRFFAGSGVDGVIQRSLVVGTSLNFMMNGTGRPEAADFQFQASPTPVAFATYHGDFSMHHNIISNFPVDSYDRAGVFASDDYYLRPVEMSMIRNFDNLIIESHLGVKLDTPQDYFSLAGALWDPFGFWGPTNNYIVYDDPFFTHGKTITPIAPGVDVVNSVSVEGPFYGIMNFTLNHFNNFPDWAVQDYMAIHVDRLDPNDLTSTIASWSVASVAPTTALGNMRDFAVTPDGIYELTFPEEASHPTNFQFAFENMLEDTDTVVIGIQFDGSLNPAVYVQQETDVNNFLGYTEVGSLQDVINSDGETFWQDNANNRIWVKLRGGRWVESPDDTGNFVHMTYERMLLRIREL